MIGIVYVFLNNLSTILYHQIIIQNKDFLEEYLHVFTKFQQLIFLKSNDWRKRITFINAHIEYKDFYLKM